MTVIMTNVRYDPLVSYFTARPAGKEEISNQTAKQLSAEVKYFTTKGVKKEIINKIT